MLNKLINSSAKTITSGAIIIGGLALVSRVLGVLRDRVLASEFGAGNALDIYYAAFRLPDLIFNLLVLGAISAGLIPVFTGLLTGKKEDKKAWKLISNILNILLVGLLASILILYFFTPWLMRFLTPGFTGEKFDLVVSLTRIMYLSPIFLAMSAIFGAVLQSTRKFFIYALAPIFYNIGIIIGALFLTPLFGIYGLAYGVVIGSLFHLLIQLPAVFSSGYSYNFSFDIRNKYVKKVLRLMLPRTLTLVINQLNILAITVVASTMAAGSLTVFNLAYNLQSFPLGIFAVSFAIAALPTLSVLAGIKLRKKFVSTYSLTFRQILFCIFPLSVLLYVLRAQVVRVVLGAGNFSWLDTRLTAATVGLFVLSLFAQALIPLTVRAFYALHNSKTPFFVGLFAFIFNLISLFYFRYIFSFVNWFSYNLSVLIRVDDLWGVADLRVLALPLALSVSSIINFSLLLLYLRLKIKRIDGYHLFRSSFRIIIASIGGGLSAYFTMRLINLYVVTDTFVGILTQGFLAGLIGLVAYVLVGFILKMEELNIFVGSLRRKFFKVSIIKEAQLEEDILE